MNRGYLSIPDDETEAISRQALERVKGARLISIVYVSDTDGSYELGFDNGLTLLLDGPYDEGCEAGIKGEDVE